jgi:hypothetical protein
VEWDRKAPSAPLGQAPVFIDFLKAGVLLTLWSPTFRCTTRPNAPDRPFSISFSSVPKASISFRGGFQKLPLLSKSCKKFPRIWTYQGVTGDKRRKKPLERADRRRRPQRAPRCAAPMSAPRAPDRPFSISFSSVPKASTSFRGGFQKLPLLSKSCKKFPRIWTYQGVTGDKRRKKTS